MDGSGLGKKGGKGTSGKGTTCEKDQRPRRAQGFAICQDFHAISGEKVGIWRGGGRGTEANWKRPSNVPRDFGFQLKATRSR